MTELVRGERVVVREGARLVRGTVRQVLAGRHLVIELLDGRRVRRTVS